ncbi:hypothetical protein [Polyangium aurulentum]|uniref:hypothetical protein n=1 Tax=Polyangium aurulentum TaxID=2567896 RepID=UPI0010AEB515|nr:hypothetical protein [Polyangium aurulentum]UQA54915.1 hypothetical protein E8A73_026510 [Polyangium aurulentum]
MNLDPSRLLALSAAAQLLFSSLLGVFMLVLMQPWGQAFARRAPRLRDLGSAHLDWIVLALMQFGAAYALGCFPVPRAMLAAVLLVIGGWLNPLPYIARGLGINAFVLGGGRKQIAFALLGALSSAAIVAGWGMILTAMIGSLA